MFVLKKQIDSGIFDLLFTKVKYMFNYRFNHVNQCTKLILHSLSLILDQNDNNEIEFIICHILWTEVFVYFIISVKPNFSTQLFNH